jgi:predicted nucleotidyltransferase
LTDDVVLLTGSAMTAPFALTLKPDVLAPICQRHGIRRLAVFGSRLKGTARADSDLDLLVEFEPDRTPGLLGLSGIQIELTEALGVQVDLRTPQELSRYFRDEVLQQAQVAYGA